MNTTRIISALLLAVAVGIVAWGLSSLHSQQPQQQPESHLLAGLATTTAAGAGYEYTEDHPYYTVDLVYPETRNQAEQTAVETALKTELDGYAQSVADVDASVLPSLQEGYKLALDIDYQKFTGAGETTSYLFTVFEDTGGAHPNHYFRTFVFTPAGATLGLGDLFVSTSTNSTADYLNQIAEIATADVTEQLQERLGDDSSDALFADGLAPTVDNYQNFVLDGSTLKILFPPYQVAAYAAGDFEVDIPLSTFGATLKPDIH